MGSEPRFEPRPELIDLPVLQKFKLYATPSVISSSFDLTPVYDL
jgi:hypothetical protein